MNGLPVPTPHGTTQMESFLAITERAPLLKYHYCKMRATCHTKLSA